MADNKYDDLAEKSLQAVVEGTSRERYLLPSFVGTVVVSVHQQTDEEDYPRIYVKHSLSNSDYKAVVRKMLKEIADGIDCKD